MFSNALEAFKFRLKRLLNMELELVINENKSTMLHLLGKSRTTARLSLHRMFLEAPDPVLGAIAHYVQGNRKERPQHNRILRQFIQDHLAQADYSHLINRRSLLSEGKFYHLGEIYNNLNKEYFNNELSIPITWFGKVGKRNKSRITFGQYLCGLRLIKIHRMLDDPFFPDYFVSFVVYHEMLHGVIPGSMDKRGRYCFHSAPFKEQERCFKHYKEASEWERENKMKLFANK